MSSAEAISGRAVRFLKAVGVVPESWRLEPPLQPSVSAGIYLMGVSAFISVVGALLYLAWTVGELTARLGYPGLLEYLQTFEAQLLGLALAGIGGLSYLVGRVLLSVQLRSSRIEKETDALLQASNEIYRGFEQARQARERREAQLFERNLAHRFVLQSFELANVRFFESSRYQLAPRVNVLLGKNGYGKTLLLRSMAALVQRSIEHSDLLLAVSANQESTPLLRLEVTRNGKLEAIRRDATYFDDIVGKIPLLAIPDTRFVDRAETTIAASATGGEPLASSGAYHYLKQKTYSDVVSELLAGLAIDYFEKRDGFDQPIFGLIERVVAELTDDDQFAFDTIRRTGRTGFEILVRTAGSGGEAIPIQYASQGTLSVLAIFGLVYSFLGSLPDDVRRGGDIFRTPGIVIIDELDAHLHPSWQQKVLRMLTTRFPNVQFIVSAHSPVIAAGCRQGEVSVLRKGQDGRFRVETSNRDYLGEDPIELLRDLFEIEEFNRLYLHYANEAKRGADKELRRRIAGLEKTRQLSAEEEGELERLRDELDLIERARRAHQQKLEEISARTHVEDLEDENRRLRRKLERITGEEPRGELPF